MKRCAAQLKNNNTTACCIFNSPAKSANNGVLFQTMLGSGANVVMGANGDDAEQKLA